MAWGIQGGRRMAQAGHPTNGREAGLGVARLQGVEGSGMAGLGEILGSPWIFLAIRACLLYPYFRLAMTLSGFLYILSCKVGLAVPRLQTTLTVIELASSIPASHLFVCP
jgi:hypothetical protein